MSSTGGDVSYRFSGKPGAAWWVLSAFMLLVFLVLAHQVGQDSELIEFDQSLAWWLSTSMAPGVLWFLSWFTYLGGRDFLTGVAVAITVMLLLRREWVVAVVCAIATGGGGLLTTVMKQTFERVRPEHVHGYVLESGWSFPSGHAGASMAVYGFVCYLLLREIPAQWHRCCLVTSVVFIGAIGASRVLLQVHFLTDVIAGFALSLSWLSLWIGVLVACKKPN